MTDPSHELGCFVGSDADRLRGPVYSSRENLNLEASLQLQMLDLILAVMKESEFPATGTAQTGQNTQLIIYGKQFD
jgi:hypothetical protein